ncbi:NADPH-dependent FMN reductase [Gayadomonas joobiniege]|uniref:NADPH-dependent FMN reductase n=1 Tax=Gayadomonas joobiniege TaxID=1234606 RepID=UPI00036E9034|nr:NAD(P)H-dependent oxidoreductase [Gayadomonas joobiniege]
MKIIAFAASTSRQSINRKLLKYISQRISNRAEFELIDLNEYELPLFSEDLEREIGKPANAQHFLNKVNQADYLIISFAEHNGSYTAAYKNLFDWASRIQPKVYQDKKVILFSASPGPGGAKNVLSQAKASMPHFGAEIISSYSVAEFYKVFDVEQGQPNSDELARGIEHTLSELVERSDQII